MRAELNYLGLSSGLDLKVIEIRECKTWVVKIFRAALEHAVMLMLIRCNKYDK